MDSSDDVRARWSAGLRDAAARAYAASQGTDPPTPRPTRWRIDSRAATTACVAIALLAAVAWWGLRAEAPVPLAAPAPATTEAEATASATVGGASTATTAVVHVSGAVREPGLVTVPQDARVVDAVEGAGGLTEAADEASVNLARPVVDGEHIVVLERATAGAPTMGGAGPAQAGTASSAVNLNSADATMLETLPGIGPVLAERIVADREANGPFLSIDDLSRVSGVGPAILEAIADAATT